MCIPSDALGMSICGANCRSTTCIRNQISNGVGTRALVMTLAYRQPSTSSHCIQYRHISAGDVFNLKEQNVSTFDIPPLPTPPPVPPTIDELIQVYLYPSIVPPSSPVILLSLNSVSSPIGLPRVTSEWPSNNYTITRIFRGGWRSLPVCDCLYTTSPFSHCRSPSCSHLCPRSISTTSRQTESVSDWDGRIPQSNTGCTEGGK